MADADNAAENQPDDTVPSAERQAELEAQYQANIVAGREPYAGVAFQTRGEFIWVLRVRNWHCADGDNKECARLSRALIAAIDLSDIVLDGVDLSESVLNRTSLSGVSMFGADLSHAQLFGVNLSNVSLEGANLTKTHFVDTNLAGARLNRANLSGAQLVAAQLPGASLMGAVLSNANLVQACLDGADLVAAKLPRVRLDGATLVNAKIGIADLSGASLRGANLVGARLPGADLAGADLSDTNLEGTVLRDCRLDVKTRLEAAKLDSKSMVADVVWDGTPLTRIAWENLPRLGDEQQAVEGSLVGENVANDALTRLDDYMAAGRAYRQLSVALRAQGLNEPADNYAYRAQLMQREVYRLNKKWGPFLFSWFLFFVSGYGYRLWRIAATYGVTLLAFTLIYFALGVHSFPHEPGWRALWDSFLVSLSAIHGRTTFEQLGAWSPAAWWAAVESVCGIVIEGVFVAMLVQRFFAR